MQASLYSSLNNEGLRVRIWNYKPPKFDFLKQKKGEKRGR